MPFKFNEDKKNYHKEYHKIWYEKNKADVLEKQRKRAKEIRDWYRSYKADLKCEVCGFQHPAAIDFHHREGEIKNSEVNRLYVSKASIEKIKTEIDKCDVLCSNCHRIRHWDERARSSD